MFNASERKDVRRAEKEAKLAEQQRRETIFGLMSTISGRRWVLDILESCHVFSTSFSREAIVMAFMEGQRDIGLRLLNDVMATSADLYILMMRERNETDAARRKRSTEPAGSANGDGRDQGPESTGDNPYGDPADGDRDETAGDEAR